MNALVCIFVTTGDGEEVGPPAEGEEESSNAHAPQSTIKPWQPCVQRIVTHRHG